MDLDTLIAIAAPHGGDCETISRGRRPNKIALVWRAVENLLLDVDAKLIAIAASRHRR